MNLGLFMMPLHPPHRSIADSYDRDLELITLGDQLGYRECWIGEHITERWETAPTPELLIAKALAMTEQIVLATGVTLLAVHHPAEVAHRIAMLDHMARGRFYWGIGIRALTTDLSLFGIDSATVGERSREALQVILGMWQSEDGEFDFDGKHFQVHATRGAPELERYLYMKPYQQPHPPIGVASTSPGSETIRLAGERGWIPMSSSNLLERDLFKHWDLIREGRRVIGPATRTEPAGASPAMSTSPSPTSRPARKPLKSSANPSSATRSPTSWPKAASSPSRKTSR